MVKRHQPAVQTPEVAASAPLKPVQKFVMPPSDEALFQLHYGHNKRFRKIANALRIVLSPGQQSPEVWEAVEEFRKALKAARLDGRAETILQNKRYEWWGQPLPAELAPQESKTETLERATRVSLREKHAPAGIAPDAIRAEGSSGPGKRLR